MKRFISLLLAVLFVCTLFGNVAAESAAAPAKEDESALSEASLKWRAFDKALLYYLLKEDVSTTNQIIKNPETLNLQPEDIVITLGSYDKSEYDRYYTDLRALYADLLTINREELLPEEQYAYDAVRTAIEWDMEGEQYYGYFEPLTFSGIQSDLPMVFWLYDIDSAEDAETYLALLSDVPNFMHSLVEYEKYRVELGIFMPENALETVLGDCRDVVDSAENCFLIASFERAVDGISGLTAAQRKELKARNRELIQTAYIGGYQTLYDELDKLRPYCRPDVGIAELGNETYLRFYEYYLRITCNDDVTVQSAAALMEEYIEKDWKIAYDMYLKGVDYFEGTLSIGTVEENMQYLKELSASILPEVPETEITYYTVPKEMQDVFPPAAYLVAALDDPSHVVIMLNDPENDASLLRTLAHEGWYGHLYQYAGTRGSCTSLSQQLLQSTAYSEAFSQMAELFFTESTEAFDRDSLALTLHEGWMETELIAYCGILVNGLGFTRTRIKTLLKETYGYDAATAGLIYDICVEQPFYYLPYAYGICRFRQMYEKLGYTDWMRFYEDCFAVGPTFFHLLEKACRERNGLGDAEEAAPETDSPNNAETVEELFFGEEAAAA